MHSVQMPPLHIFSVKNALFLYQIKDFFELHIYSQRKLLSLHQTLINLHGEPKQIEGRLSRFWKDEQVVSRTVGKRSCHCFKVVYQYDPTRHVYFSEDFRLAQCQHTRIVSK